MLKKLYLYSTALWLMPVAYAQVNADSSTAGQLPVFEDTLAPKKNYELVFKPTFGLGIGNFTFVGDVGNSYKGFHSLVSRMGYELKVNNPLSQSFDLGFYVIFGKVSANERDGLRNLNFESRIRTGGAILSYNFSRLLPPGHNIEPYIFTGFESFEFLSKTDLRDAYGNTYNYWSDGSIRSLPENHPNAATAIMVHRDYTYESDLREQNLDGLGKYRERSWSVPVGVGVQFLISNRVKFKMGTSLHFTFTDLVDNVSAESVGNRKGDSKNDKFLYSSFSLHYDLAIDKPKKIPGEKPLQEEDDSEGPMVLDMTDEDGDGIRDFRDDCLHTPPGVPVDEHGCPFDKDNDNVPDYRDDEKQTPRGNIVNINGVTMTEEEIDLIYLKYIDSTGIYHGGFGKVDREEVGGGNGSLVFNKGAKPRQNLTYFIVIGTEKKQIEANDLYKYLGQKDFKQMESGDTIFYVLGNYNSITEALARQQELEKNGIATNGLGETNSAANTNTVLTDKQVEEKLETEKANNAGSNGNTNTATIVYRVQIGAYDKKLSDKIFQNVPELVYITGPDGTTRYYSGSFTSIEQAAQRKVDMLADGFESAFIVAYKGGRRVPLHETGAEMVNENEKDNIQINDLEASRVDAKKVKFKVQVGAFRNDIPANILDIYLGLGEIQLKRNDSGMTLYLVGNENTVESAEQIKAQMVAKGITDAFVVGEFKGTVIPASEALILQHK